MAEAALIVATRRSKLALAQSRAWLAPLRATGSIEELLVVTTGDRVQDRSLSEIGGKGLFIKEIEEVLLAGKADFAVHSLKDVPASLAPGLELGSVSPRADARDAIVTRTGCSFEALPRGSKVGSSSLRRLAQLQAWRPDLVFVPIRGNVDTRLLRCSEGAVDAVVLALAGLERLGLGDRVSEVFDPERCLPAIGQGALAVEQRVRDEKVGRALASLDDPTTRFEVASERGVMRAVEGNCQIPVGALAIKQGGSLWLRGFLARPDGTRAERAERKAPWPASSDEADRLGFELGEELRARVG